jgi:transposase InsO family protein
MGAVGSSADNALAESFNATLKREVLQDAHTSPDEASCRREVFRRIVRYTRRRHSWCRYHSPSIYETPLPGYAAHRGVIHHPCLSPDPPSILVT